MPRILLRALICSGSQEEFSFFFLFLHRVWYTQEYLEIFFLKKFSKLGHHFNLHVITPLDV